MTWTLMKPRISSPVLPANTRLQRKCHCGNTVHHADEECEACRRSQGPALQSKLLMGALDDPLEREADLAAARVSSDGEAGTLSPRPIPRLSRLASDGAERTRVPDSVGRSLQAHGEPLPVASRAYFEPRFGHDFGHVRIHRDADSAQSAHDVAARAYTVGRHVVFGNGQFAPEQPEGRQLLAHELAHVVQQSPVARPPQAAKYGRHGSSSPQVLRRTPNGTPAADTTTADPICTTFVFQDVFDAVLAGADAFVASGDIRPLVQNLKRIRRCASDTQTKAVLDTLVTRIGEEKTREAWEASGTAFGGYAGLYPGYAPDIKRHLTQLGASETAATSTFETSASGATHRSRAKSAAKRSESQFERTDILYFRGHQYAQYKAPGLFGNGSETRAIDLRYVEKTGGLPNVKLMISTSCATLCSEAIDVFSSLLPNAVILGYRKSAPIDGAAIRNDFTAQVNALNRPLLLDEPVDVDAIISIWKSIVQTRHKDQEGPKPGIYRNGNVEYWDGTAWHTIAASDAANTCKKKGDFRGQYPAP